MFDPHLYSFNRFEGEKVSHGVYITNRPHNLSTSVGLFMIPESYVFKVTEYEDCDMRDEITLELYVSILKYYESMVSTDIVIALLKLAIF